MTLDDLSDFILTINDWTKWQRKMQFLYLPWKTHLIFCAEADILRLLICYQGIGSFEWPKELRSTVLFALGADCSSFCTRQCTVHLLPTDLLVCSVLSVSYLDDVIAYPGSVKQLIEWLDAFLPDCVSKGWRLNLLNVFYSKCQSHFRPLGFGWWYWATDGQSRHHLRLTWHRTACWRFTFSTD